MHRDLASSVLNVVLGAWLAVTSLLWHHDLANLVSGLVVAAVAIAAGVLTRRRSWVFWIDLALAVWLFASIWILPHRPFASWNQTMVAIGLALLPVSMRLFPEPPSTERAGA